MEKHQIVSQIRKHEIACASSSLQFEMAKYIFQSTEAHLRNKITNHFYCSNEQITNEL